MTRGAEREGLNYLQVITKPAMESLYFGRSRKTRKSLAPAVGLQEKRTYEFGPFQIHAAERLLLRDGRPISVTAKALDTLLLLIQRSSHLFEKSEIMEAIWPDSFVAEANLPVTIHMLRKALGDDGSEHRYIETVPKRGYRFVGGVREIVISEVALRPMLRTASVSMRRVPRRVRAMANHYPPKSVRLDDSRAEAYASLALISFYKDWNWTEAEREFRRSLEFNPGYAMAHIWYALQLAAQGRSEEAIDHAQRAQTIEPLSPIITVGVGRVCYLSRRYDQSVIAYRKVIDSEPHFVRAHTRLGITRTAEGKFADAIREFHEAQRLSRPYPHLNGLLGYAYALSGETETALEALENLTQRSLRQCVPAYSMALVSIGLGDYGRALDLLEGASLERSRYMVFAKSDPLLDPIRSEPRFAALLEGMALS
jgi:DNA-binding winged helix-turn-helix (wHTH) protein/Flp pilus assembly protein TadD